MSAVSHVKSNSNADFSGTVTVFNSQGSTTTMSGTDMVRPSDWNSAHNFFLTLQGNTAGQSTVSGTNLEWAGGPGILLSAATAAGAATVTIGEPFMSVFEPPMLGSTQTQTLANGQVYFQPFLLPYALSAYELMMIQDMTSVSASTLSVSGSVSGGSTESATGSFGMSGTALLFTRQSTGTDAHSSNLLSAYSNTYTYSAGMTESVSWSTNASSVTVSWSTTQQVGYLANIDSAGGVTTTSTTSSGSNSFSTTSTNAQTFSSQYTASFASQVMSGMRPIFVPFNVSMSPGEYWLANIQSTTTGSGGGNTRIARPVFYQEALLGFSSQSNNLLQMGDTQTRQSSQWRPGWGSYNTSANTTTTVALSAISGMSNFETYFNLNAWTH
jgi:hypothetical protein